MGTIATLAINIIGNIQGLEQALGKAQQSLKSAGDNLTNLGGKLTAGVSLPILGVGGAALKAAADNEQLQVAFTTMLGSADKATSLMKDLSTFAAATPFESDEIQGAAKMLLAYGSSASGVTDEMRQLGDIAAGVGVPLKDMAYLYGTARVQGRLFTADINQFTSRGVPIMEALAATMGVATSEIRGMVEEGKVGFPELQAALGYLTKEGGKFNGLMQAQSTTLTGLFSTLKDNVALAMIDIGNAIAQAFDLKNVAAQAIAGVESIRNAISDMAKNNPELLRMGVIVATVVAAVGPALVGVGWLLKSLAFLTPVLGVLGSALGLLVSPLGLVALGFAALVALDIGGIGTALGDLGQYFLAVAQDGDYLNDWLTHLPEAIQPAVMALGQFVAAVGGLTQGGDLGTFIAEITAIDWGGALGAVGDSLNQLKDNIIAAIQGIDWGGALATAGGFLDSFRDGVIGAITAIDWEGGLAAAGAFLEELKNGVVGAIQSVDWGGALTTAGDFLSGLTQGVISAVTAIDWGGLLAAAGDMLTGLRDGVAGALGQIDWAGALATAGTWVESLKNNVIAAIQGIDWSGALATAGNAFATLETAVADGLRALGFTEAADSLNLETVQANFQTFVDSLGTLQADIGAKVELIKAAFQPLVDFLAPSFERLKVTVSGLPEQFGALGEKFEPLKEAATALGTAIAGLFSGGGEGGAVTTGAYAAILAGSLSLLTNTVNGLLGALAPLAGAFIDQLTTLMSGLAEVVNGLGTAFNGLVTNDPTMVLQGLSTAFQGVKDIVVGTFENSLTAVQVALDAIGTIVTTTLADWGFGAAAESVQTLVTNVSSLLEKVKAIASGDAAIDFAAPDWIVQLLGWLWPKLDLPDWAESLLSWQWPSLDLPDWIESLMAWQWPSLDLPDWLDGLLDWQWPSLDAPEWLDKLFGFEWPSINLPGPLMDFLGIPHEAVGTSYFGGGLVNASETSPEVAILPRGLNVLPRGTQILNGRDSENFLAGAGGGGVTVIIQSATIRSERDVQRLAREIDDIQDRRRRI